MIDKRLKSKPADLWCGDTILACTEAISEPVEFEVKRFESKFIRTVRHAKGGDYPASFLNVDFNRGEIKKVRSKK